MNRSCWNKGFRLGNRSLGGLNPTYFIAEIGSNHDGDIKRAYELIDACARSGANAVKFQSWQAHAIQNSKDLGPGGELMESRSVPILKKYELSEDWHSMLADHCRQLKVDFLSTPFDPERARLLRQLGVPAIKIASGDLTYDSLLAEVGSYGLPVFLSTGMANLGEIERALEILGLDSSREIILLHCVGAYPPQPEDANLLSMRTLIDTFGLPVGFSDHYPGHDFVLAAVALGACVIEKHVTFRRTDATPDAPFAMEFEEFSEMIRAVRRLEQALGDGVKRCMPSESGGLVGGRRCLYAAKDLKAGAVLCAEDIAVVRPNIGPLKPHDLEKTIGRRLGQDVSCGVPLKWEVFET